MAFFLVNAILLNVVFGIIIDSFAERRDQQKSYSDDKLYKCTICGFQNSDFPPKMFMQHVKKEASIQERVVVKISI